MSKWDHNKTNYQQYFVCKRVCFYSSCDETVFFAWIEKIPCIESIAAASDELYLDVVERDLTKEDLIDLAGLFKRYKITGQQLKAVDIKEDDDKLGNIRYINRYPYKSVDIQKNILICKKVWFYSQQDEDAFFEWLTKIPSILKVEGVLDSLYITVKNRRISNKDLRELIALFYRYKVDMKQLSIFLNSKNKEWFFGSPKGYWHRRVFGQGK